MISISKQQFCSTTSFQSIVICCLVSIGSISKKGLVCGFFTFRFPDPFLYMFNNDQRVLKQTIYSLNEQTSKCKAHHHATNSFFIILDAQKKSFSTDIQPYGTVVLECLRQNIKTKLLHADIGDITTCRMNITKKTKLQGATK